jgi:hypothetical protein
MKVILLVLLAGTVVLAYAFNWGPHTDAIRLSVLGAALVAGYLIVFGWRRRKP